MILYHGSDHIIRKPSIQLGKTYNDYGQGFYLTADYELAGEWACRKKIDGYINEYEINLDELKVLDLQSEKFSVLNWISLLLNNRTFEITGDVAIKAKEFLIKEYLPDSSWYDVIIGYRADDSYFSYAESFINNGLSLRKLEQAMKLGKLGIQYALVSKKAFDMINYVTSYHVDSNVYHKKYKQRDDNARAYFRDKLQLEGSSSEDIYMMDIMRRSENIYEKEHDVL